MNRKKGQSVRLRFWDNKSMVEIHLKIGYTKAFEQGCEMEDEEHI